MSKTVYRSMTVGELKHFLKRFVAGAPLRAITLDDPGVDAVDLPFTAGALLELVSKHADDEPVCFVSPLGRSGVLGFFNTVPPALFVSLTSDSIQSN